MANIVPYINQLSDSSTDGQKARSIMIAACEDINKNGTNAKTLNGHGADYYFSVNELNITFNPYLRRIGLVHDLNRVLDENGNSTILTEIYDNKIKTTASSNSTSIVDTPEVQIGINKDKPVYRKEFANNGRNTTILVVYVKDIDTILSARAIITNIGEVEVRAFAAGDDVSIDYPEIYPDGQPIKNVMRVILEYTKKSSTQVSTSNSFDITLPTSNAIWQKLGYSELSDLQSYIND